MENLLSPPYMSPAAMQICIEGSIPKALNTSAVSSGVKGHPPIFRFFSESFFFFVPTTDTHIWQIIYTLTITIGEKKYHNLFLLQRSHAVLHDNFYKVKRLIRNVLITNCMVVISTSVLLILRFPGRCNLPCNQKNANMSISYRRCRTINGPFCLRSFTIFLPVSSIRGVNFRAW